MSSDEKLSLTQLKQLSRDRAFQKEKARIYWSQFAREEGDQYLHRFVEKKKPRITDVDRGWLSDRYPIKAYTGWEPPESFFQEVFCSGWSNWTKPLWSELLSSSVMKNHPFELGYIRVHPSYGVALFSNAWQNDATTLYEELRMVGVSGVNSGFAPLEWVEQERTIWKQWNSDMYLSSSPTYPRYQHEFSNRICDFFKSIHFREGASILIGYLFDSSLRSLI
jgi:hypothetical protein